MATEVERLVIRLIGDTLSYTESIDKVLKKNKDLVSSVSILKEQFNTLKIALSLTDDFNAFNKALVESQAIMTMTAKQSSDMEKQALELGSTTNRSSTEIAKGYFFLASAGLNVNQQLAAMPIVAKFATAGMMSLERATSLASDAQSAMGLKVADTEQYMRNLTRVTDVLVKANVLANANVEQFSIALTSKAGASLKATNKSIEEGTAVLAAMADQGIKGEVAGNALSRMLLLLKKSSIDNAESQQRLGFSVYDNTGKMRNLADIVEQLEKITGDMSDETKAAAFEQLGFTARIQAFILPLLGTSQKIREYEKELKSAGGTTKIVSEKIMQSFSAQLTLLKNNITNLSIAFGGPLSDLLTIVVKAFTALIQAVDRFDKMGLPAIFSMVSGELSKYDSLLSGVVSSGAAFVAFFTSLTVIVPLATKALIALGEGIKSLWLIMLKNKYAIIIALVLAFGAAYNKLALHSKEAAEAEESFTKLAEKRKSMEIDKANTLVQKTRTMDEAKAQKELEKKLAYANQVLDFRKRKVEADKELMSGYTGVGISIAKYIPFVTSSITELNASIDQNKIAYDSAAESVGIYKEELDRLEKKNRPTKLALEVQANNLIKDINDQKDTFNKTTLESEFDRISRKAREMGYDISGFLEDARRGFSELNNLKLFKEAEKDLDKMKDKLEALTKKDDVSSFVKRYNLNPFAEGDKKLVDDYKNTMESIRKKEEQDGFDRRAKEIKDKYTLPEEKLNKGREELDALLNKNLITIGEYNLAMEDLKKTLLGVSDAQKQLNASMSYGNSESFRFIYEYMSGFGDRNKPNFVKKSFDFSPKMKNVLAMNVDTDNQGKNAIDLLSKAVGYLEEIAGGEGTPLSLANLS